MDKCTILWTIFYFCKDFGLSDSEKSYISKLYVLYYSHRLLGYFLKHMALQCFVTKKRFPNKKAEICK